MALHPQPVVAAVAFAMASIHSTASAQAAAPAERITVTASRTPTAISDLAASVSIVEEEAIGEQLAITTNILSLLDVLVPSLTVGQSEARLGCRTNIRGRPAQFLINGVPTNDDLRRSSCATLYGVNPYALERIEVVRGSSSLYGAGAPGGIVNLMTRSARSDRFQLDAVARWGGNPHESDDSSETIIYVGGGQKARAWDYYFGLGWHDYGARRNPYGGIVPGTEFEAASAHATVGAALGPGRLRFTGLFNREEPQRTWATDFTQVSGQRFADRVLVVDPPNPHAGQAKTQQHVATLAYELPNMAGHELVVSVYDHRERVIQRMAEFFAGEAFYFDSDAENERRGARATARWRRDFRGGEADITYGVDALRQRYYRPQVDPALGTVVGFVSPEVILRSTALFAQPAWRTGPWRFQAGLRHERFEGEVGAAGYDPSLPRATPPGNIPSFDLTLFNAGAVYDVNPAVQLFASFSQGAEVSEFGRAARGAADPGLINLEAAKSDQVEVGARGRWRDTDFSFAIFVSESDKAASLRADPTCSGQPLCPLIPLRRAQELRGFELTADWRISQDWTAGTAITWQEGEFTEPGADPAPFATDTISPPRLVLYAEHRAGAWTSRVQMTAVGSTDEFNEEQVANGARNTSGYALADLSVSRVLGPGRLTLAISNLFNRSYVNVTNQASGDFFYYLSEGRRASLAYQASF